LTGKGINPEISQLMQFPVRIEDGMICVEVPDPSAIPQALDMGED